jgi:hypothetical protein
MAEFSYTKGMKDGMTALGTAALRLMICIVFGITFSCASMPDESGTADAISLDEGIAQIAAGLAARIPVGRNVFLAGLEESGSGDNGGNAVLGQYIAGHLRDTLEDAGWTFIAQQNAALLSGEEAFFISQKVTSEAAQRIGYELGAQTVIYGTVRPVDGKPSGKTEGGRRQISLFATDTTTGRTAGQTIQETRTVAAPPLKLTAESRFWLYDGRDNAFALNVAAVSEGGLFHAGEELRWLITAERDCYIKLTFVDVKGNLAPLYPLDNRDDVFLRGGEERVLPDYGRLIAAEPYGEAYLLLAAYERPFLTTAQSTGEVWTLRAEPATRAALLRSLAVTARETGRETVPLAAAVILVKIAP